MSNSSKFSVSASSLLLVVPLVGCGADYDSDESVSTVAQAVWNGTRVKPWDFNSPDVRAKPLVYIQSNATCTGTIVQPSWVLTAKHCLTELNGTVTNKRSATVSQARTIDAVVNNLDPSLDVQMLHVSSPFTGVTPAPLVDAETTTASLYGSTLSCYGWGNTQVNSAGVESCLAFDTTCGGANAGLLTKARLVAESNSNSRGINPNLFDLPVNGLGQLQLSGDSGGPCFFGNGNGSIAGFESYGNFDITTQGSVPASRDWIMSPSRVMITPGDFSGDNKTDFILTTPAGSRVYIMNAETPSHEIRATAGPLQTDLPLGKVMFTVGYFNSDTRADYIVTTPAGATPGGSTFKFAQPDGSFSSGPLKTEWPLHSVAFTPGDFDGDGRTDLIVTMPEPDMTLRSAVYYRDGLIWTLYKQLPDAAGAKFVTGKFDADNRTDVIMTTPTGSDFYYPNDRTNWTIGNARPDLPLQAVGYVTGDLDGSNGDDLIITTPFGSYWYYSTNTRGVWNEIGVRSDLTLGSVTFQTGDFDGSGKDDMLIQTATGSYWYYSTNTRGVWNDIGARSDLTRYSVSYTTADFTGEGKTDMIITNVTGSYFYYSTSSTPQANWNTSWTQTSWAM